MNIVRKQFDANGRKYEIRAMRVPEGIVAKAFSADGVPAGNIYHVSHEVAQDIETLGKGNALAIIMAAIEDDIKHNRMWAIEKAINDLNNG